MFDKYSVWPVGWVAVAMCAALAGCGGDDSKNKDAKSAVPAGSAKAALTVRLTSPVSAEWATPVASSGSIAAWQESVVGSEIGGLRLTELQAAVGDSVKKGQVLATLADETVRADLVQAKAALREAEAVYAEAKANGDRARKFDGTGAISQQQTMQYLTAEQTAKARIDVAKARLDADELRLKQIRVMAPDDGVVSARAGTLGSVVSPGQELFRVILKGRLEWRAEVASADLARVKSGAMATLVLPSGARVSGRVRVVGPAVDAQTRNGVVYVDLTSIGEARAGMFARGEIALGQAKALTLPQSSVLLRDGFSYVFKVGTDRKVLQAKVVTGRRVGDRVEVLSGLAETDRVVETGAGFLGDGDLVEVVTTSVAAPVSPATSAAPSPAKP